MKSLCGSIIFVFLIFLSIFILPNAAFAPQVGERLSNVEKFINYLLVIFSISGVILCYINIGQAVRTCSNLSLKESCQIHGNVYTLWAVLSAAASPFSIANDGFFLFYINFYFPIINWLLLVFWIILGRMPQKKAPTCKILAMLPTPRLSLTAFIIFILPPTVFAPFYLVSLFL